MRLIFQSLELKNYRYYYGTQKVEFPTDSEKNVLVIKGDNGAGKSNLLNALTWCLYGEEIHTDKNTKGLPLMNTEYIKELAETNREGETSVTLTIDADGQLWEIQRTIRAHASIGSTSDGQPLYDFKQGFTNLKVTYFDERGNQKIEVGNLAQKLVDDLLPEALRSFFFIDGEQLREFFKVDSSNKMQKSIERLSQLDLLQRVQESLSFCRKELRDKLKNSNPATAKIQGEIQEKESSLGEIDKGIEKLEEALRQTHAELDRVSQYLTANSIEKVSSLSKEIESLEKIYGGQTYKYDKLIKKKEKFLLESAPAILLADVIDDSSKMIGDLIEKGDLPPKIKESFIEELLETGICICGTKLTDTERQRLTAYADKIQLSELTGIAFEGKEKFANLKTNIDTFLDELENIKFEIDELDEEMRSTRDTIEQKKEEILNYNVEEINYHVNERNRLHQNIGSINNKLELLKRKEESAQSDLRRLYRQEEIENQKHSIHDQYTKQVEFVQEAFQVLERIQERVKEKIRKSIEENTKKHFMEFLREEGVFRDVSIDKNYQVSVVNAQGFNALADLSAGQYLILGYAFVVALRTITGYNAPVIVDTPLGKLDTIHRNKITKQLPELLGNVQLVFLVTSSEYTEDVRENFAPYMMDSAYYEIERDPEKTSARLIQNAK